MALSLVKARKRPRTRSWSPARAANDGGQACGNDKSPTATTHGNDSRSASIQAVTAEWRAAWRGEHALLSVLSPFSYSLYFFS